MTPKCPLKPFTAEDFHRHTFDDSKPYYLQVAELANALMQSRWLEAVKAAPEVSGRIDRQGSGAWSPTALAFSQLSRRRGKRMHKCSGDSVRDKARIAELEAENAKLKVANETLARLGLEIDLKRQAAVIALEQIAKKVPQKVSREEAADMACEFVLVARKALGET